MFRKICFVKGVFSVSFTKVAQVGRSHAIVLRLCTVVCVLSFRTRRRGRYSVFRAVFGRRLEDTVSSSCTSAICQVGFPAHTPLGLLSPPWFLSPSRIIIIC